MQMVDLERSPREIFLRWERLRVAYNVLLGLVTAGLLATLDDELLLPGMPELLATLLVGCLLANLCFTTGPLVETYLRWLGLRSRGVTTALFAVGVLVSVPLVLLFVLAAFGWTIG
jgi:hypothetical protein